MVNYDLLIQCKKVPKQKPVVGLRKNMQKFKQQINLVVKYSNGKNYVYESKIFQVTGLDEKCVVEQRFVDDVHSNLPELKLVNISSNGKVICRERFVSNVLF